LDYEFITDLTANYPGYWQATFWGRLRDLVVWISSPGFRKGGDIGFVVFQSKKKFHMTNTCKILRNYQRLREKIQ
jgi:hypothetical protein